MGGSVVSILSGHAIRTAIAVGDIEIDPFDPKQLNPVSYDLRLGSSLRMYEAVKRPGDTIAKFLDAAVENPSRLVEIHSSGAVLAPHLLYLMHTVERIKTTKFVPVIDGKSSGGRLGIQVHATAGFGDPGFDGQYTLEVTVTQPVNVYAGMRIAQIRFHTIEGEVTQYAGNYQGETSRGPVPSMSWKQIEKDRLLR